MNVIFHIQTREYSLAVRHVGLCDLSGNFLILSRYCIDLSEEEINVTRWYEAVMIILNRIIILCSPRVWELY